MDACVLLSCSSSQIQTCWYDVDLSVYRSFSGLFLLRTAGKSQLICKTPHLKTQPRLTRVRGVLVSQCGGSNLLTQTPKWKARCSNAHTRAAHTGSVSSLLSNHLLTCPLSQDADSEPAPGLLLSVWHWTLDSLRSDRKRRTARTADTCRLYLLIVLMMDAAASWTDAALWGRN